MQDLPNYLIVFVALVIGALLINFAPFWNSAAVRTWLRHIGSFYGRNHKFLSRWIKALGTDEQGGYVHDTAMSQWIPAMMWSFVTGTFTHAAGQVANTVCMHRAAANETSVVTIPITLPSNSVAQKGAYLKSIEVDYEVLVAEPTSITWTLNKVTRGADTAVHVVAAVTKTNTVADAAAKTVDQHKQTITVTTPFWIDNDEYCLLQMSIAAGAGGNTMDLLGAVANFTLRV
jgi:hypothetical protein